MFWADVKGWASLRMQEERFLRSVRFLWIREMFFFNAGEVRYGRFGESSLKDTVGCLRYMDRQRPRVRPRSK